MDHRRSLRNGRHSGYKYWTDSRTMGLRWLREWQTNSVYSIATLPLLKLWPLPISHNGVKQSSCYVDFPSGNFSNFSLRCGNQKHVHDSILNRIQIVSLGHERRPFGHGQLAAAGLFLTIHTSSGWTWGHILRLLKYKCLCQSIEFTSILPQSGLLSSPLNWVSACPLTAVTTSLSSLSVPYPLINSRSFKSKPLAFEKTSSLVSNSTPSHWCGQNLHWRRSQAKFGGAGGAIVVWLVERNQWCVWLSEF